MQHFVLAYGAAAVEADTFVFFPSTTYGMFNRFVLIGRLLPSLIISEHVARRRSYH